MFGDPDELAELDELDELDELGGADDAGGVDGIDGIESEALVGGGEVPGETPATRVTVGIRRAAVAMA